LAQDTDDVGAGGRAASDLIGEGTIRETDLMSKFMLIESRDPFESNDVAFASDLAVGLATAGHDVTLFLVQNGVLPARRGAKAEGLAKVLSAGVRVLADEFSLSERGIEASRLVSGVTPSPIDVVVDALADGHKTLWH
jgi:predicted peroxiredoxin